MTALLLTTGYAAAENAQQAKMKSCNADAAAKGLKGADREAFMKMCLSSGSAAAAPANSQQERMKTCNADAKVKGLKGAARKTLVGSCLNGK